jgi:hypothetical protein
MGRTIAQDPLFFGASLAGGAALAQMAAQATEARAASATAHARSGNDEAA